MYLKKSYRILCCIIISLLLLCGTIFSKTRPKIYINNFINASDYKSKQNIKKYITKEFKNKLRDVQKYEIINSKKDADWDIKSIIKELKLKAYGITSYGVGGYQILDAQIKILSELKKGSETIEIRVANEDSETDKNLIFYKGTKELGMRSVIDELMEINPHSRKFETTTFYQSIQNIIKKLVIQISLKIFNKPYGAEFEVVKVRDNIILINEPVEFKLKKGDTYKIKLAHYCTTNIRIEREIKVGKIESDFRQLSIIKNENIFKSGHKITIY